MVTIVVPAASSAHAAASSVVPPPARNLHPNAPAVEIVPVPPTHRILGIAFIVKFHERIRRWRARRLHEDFRNPPKLGKQILNLALADIKR